MDKLRIEFFNATITNLKYLNISENTLRGSEGGKAIGRLLEYLPNLHHLNLNKNKLEKGGVHLFLMILKLMKLNQFNLKRLIVSKTGCLLIEDTSEVIKHPNYKLELLSLNENNLSNYGGESILRNLQLTNTIRELYLYNCSLNGVHFELI